jgi:hypothetical protein
MPKDLDVRFPAEVRQMILELTDPECDAVWRATRGWLVTRLEDDDEDELAICWVLGHVKVPKRNLPTEKDE